CEYIGKPAKKKRGSNGVELMLWLAFPLGIPYTLWRMVSKYPVCRDCGERDLVDTSTATGRRVKEKNEQELSANSPRQPRPAVDPMPVIQAIPAVKPPLLSEAVPIPPPPVPPAEKPARAYKDPNQW